MSYRIGIDIGGTFTDFTVVAADGEVLLWKEDSTPDEPQQAIVTGLQAIARQLGMDVQGLLSSTSLMVHGTTVATNMLIQRNGPLVGLLCTEGFRDILHLRDGFKPDRFNRHLPHPGTFVDRWLRLGVPERVTADGEVLRRLDEDAVRAAAGRFRDAGVQAVAVAFLWSMVRPEHELRAAELLREELPGIHVVCSHAVLPEIREWERTSATVLSAYILPTIANYLTALEARLTEGGLGKPLLIMQINGGCARVPAVIERPVNTLASGPAAAPAAALHYARTIGDDLITLDMGGTSLDVCLIRGGRPSMSRSVQVASQPIGVPAVEVHSVGAGGGSIAWVDDGGALRVGPQSAGARPGPACYDHGGTKPTVTDANVVLGYLAPDAFLGGRRTLRADLSAAVLDEHVAEPLGLNTVDAALGVISVVNTNMVAAIRSVSVERGLDPRRFTLVSGGGAGGLHCAELARELGIQQVFVPLEAGVFCSFGMTVTDVRHDHVAAHYAVSDTILLDEVSALLRDMEAKATAELLEESFAPEDITTERWVDARYAGQHNEITIPVPASEQLGPEDRERLIATFHEEHHAQFAYSRPGLPIEFLHWRVAGAGRHDGSAAAPPAVELQDAAPTRVGEAHFAGHGTVDTGLYEVAELDLGSRVAGPAVVYAPTTTIVVPPGDVLSRHSREGFVLDVAPRPAGPRPTDARTGVGSRTA